MTDPGRPTWDPDAYQAFQAQRRQPLLDLLDALPERPYRRIIDAGCGTGDGSRILADRFAANVEAVDASAQMLAAAVAHPRVRFIQADLAAWTPAAPADLVVSNAVLHWIPSPEQVLRRLASWSRDVLAVQVPANSEAPSHRIVAQVSAEGPWAEALADMPRGDHILPLRAYEEVLASCGMTPRAWDHVYEHTLPGPDAVLAWLRSTTLRPHLVRLGPHEDAFLEEVGKRLAEAYPADGEGTRFPFRRRFVVAQR